MNQVLPISCNEVQEHFILLVFLLFCLLFFVQPHFIARGSTISEERSYKPTQVKGRTMGGWGRLASSYIGYLYV